MPELVDYYTVLGIASTASADEIRRARQRLAKQYHPDRNQSPAAHQMMALVNRAATILLDPVQRARYDAQLAQENTTTEEDTPSAPSPTPHQRPRPTRAPAHRPHQPAGRTSPPRPAPDTLPATHPSLLTRAFRAALMQLVVVISWTAAIALGVGSLILVSGLRNFWLEIVVFIPLIVISYLLPSAAVTAARRWLYGPDRNPRA